MMFALKYHLVTARVCLAGSFYYSRLPWLASLPSFWRYPCIYQSIACSSWYSEASVVACLCGVPAAPWCWLCSRATAGYEQPFN